MEKDELIKEGQKFWAKTLDCSAKNPKLYNTSSKGATRYCMTFAVDQDLSKKILSLCKQNEKLICGYFVSVLGILLHKYCDQKCVSIGIPAFGYRDKNKLKNIVLPVVKTFEGEEPFKQILKGTVEQMGQVYRYQFYDVQGLLREQGECETSDLLHTIVSVGSMHDHTLAASWVEENRADLFIEIEKGEQELKLSLSCLAHQGQEMLLERIVSLIEKISQDVLEQMDRNVCDIELVDEKEKKRLQAFNDTTEIFTETTLSNFMCTSCKKYASHTALCYEDTEITYDWLLTKTNQFANLLLEHGVEIGEMVPVIAENKIETVIAILGIMAAGAAYVPIDSGYPMDRIEYTIRDCGAKHMVCIDVHMEFEQVETIDFCQHDWKEEWKKEPNVEINGDMTAYVIYTSGTTGRPKGVRVCHKNIVNTLSWRVKEFQMTTEDVCLELFSFVFDGFLTSLFTGLLSGTKVVLMQVWKNKDAHAIAEVIKKEQVTSMIVVPTLYQNILSLAEIGQLNSLKTVVLAGEKLREKLVKESKATLPHTEIVNEYGPTENSVATTILRNVDVDTNITIGKPISNTRIYILDAYGKELPIGGRGEICIAGNGVAAGYINQETLTKEKFQQDVLNETVVYHTADVGRWTEDGEIECFGRVDDQIKIRGFRVEPSEIEQVLQSIHCVKYAIVLPCETKEPVELHAYIQFEEKTDIGYVKEQMEQRLPYYMIPAAFFEVDAIPYTMNGKVNKKMLVKNGSLLKEEETAKRMPETDLEKEIAQMWCKLLEVSVVGVEDNFFALRGYSLQATMFLNEVAKTYGVTVPIAGFFHDPTIRYVCSCIEEKEHVSITRIPKAEEKEYYEMSDAQKRIYYLEQFGNLGTTYHMPAAFMTEPALDYDKTQYALNCIVEQNEILRTGFQMMDGKPVQIIKQYVKIELLHETWDEVNEEKIETFYKGFVHKFDLEKDMLIHAALIHIPDNKSILFIDMHHLISDGVTIDLLIRDFTQCYQGKHLEKKELQYKDYSQWFSNVLTEEKKQYWLSQFKEGIPSLNLPYDFQKTREASYDGGVCFAKLEQDVSKKIKDIALQYHTTEFNVFMTFVMVFLWKTVDQNQIVVGSPVSGRIHKDTEKMMGMFVNTIPFCVKIEGEETFEEMLSKVKDICADGLENQEFPVESLLKELNQTTDTNRTSLFDVMFTLDDEKEKNLSLDGITISPLAYEEITAKYDLSIGIKRTGQGYEIGFLYRKNLFEEDTVARMLKHFTVLIEHLLCKKEQKIATVSMMDEAERKLVKNMAEPLAVEFDRKNIMELFEEKVRLYPENIAVVEKDREVTYQEFLEETKLIAAWLTKKGVKPYDHVCICMDRSIRMLASIYAVLRIGAIYVPMGVRYPRKRIEYIIKDCEAACVLVDNENARELIPSFERLWVVPWKQELENSMEYDVLKEIKETPCYNKSSTDLAYMIYTSGTTGEPKGVEIEEHSLVNIIYDLETFYPMTKDSAYLWKTPVTFDVSMSELFGWFFQGGRLIVLEPDGEKDPVVIAQTIKRNQVTHVNFVPSMLGAFLGEAKRRNDFELDSLRYIFVAGEEFKMEVASQCMELCPQAKLENLYGPTEGTVYATRFAIRQIQKGKRIPIGVPCTNTKAYILSKDGELCPMGVPGELCLAGEGIARGYRNKEELTREHFVACDFTTDSLVYRTGDLARYREDGTIAYLGRMDDQVKIRGNRIELGEVENAMLLIDGVEAATVMVKEMGGQSKLLIGFFVSKTLKKEDVRKSLYLSVPEYMVPSKLIAIDEMPISQNGKVDRKKLLELEEKYTNEEIVLPKTETEKRLAEIWKRLLGLEVVGIHDAFFDVGGDSITGINLIGEINQEFHKEFQVIDIFKYVTISMLAEKLEEEDKVEEEEEIESFDF